MSLLTQLPTAKTNLKNALVSFFTSASSGKTIEESATDLANLIMDEVYAFVKEAEVVIPPLNTTVNGISSGDESANGTTSEGNGTLE